MYITKKKSKDIDVSKGSSGGDGDEDEELLSNSKTKNVYPPIETFWFPPSTVEATMDAPKGGGLGSKLLHPLRLRRSSRGSLKRAMEEKHDPKDEEAVDKLREMLFLEGQLPTKFNDYHTLLR